jgi:YegS C-terminal NAD kinase beta sandwich-like domain
LSSTYTNVVVANGQFAGVGLPIAPQPNLSDGLLDVEPAAFQIVPHALDFVVNK